LSHPYGSGVQHAVAERRGNDALRQHGADEERPACPQQHHVGLSLEEGHAFPQLVYVAAHGAFGTRTGVGRLHHVPAVAHKQVAEERSRIGGAVDEQHAAQSNVVVNESHQRPGHQPSTLHHGQQEGVGVDKLGFRGHFLDEGGDGGPEHPEAGGDQHAHQVELPGVDGAAQREHGDRQHHGAPAQVEQHHQMAAVLAIDDDAGEGQHEHAGKRGQYHQDAEVHFRVRLLQDGPGDGGGVHAAAQHGNHIGGEDEAQRPVAENGAHCFYCRARMGVRQPAGARRG
jgi:hypothetical protein